MGADLPAAGGGPGGGSVPAWNRAIVTGGLDRYAVRVAPDVAHWKRLSAVLTGTDEPSLDELLAAVPVDEALEPTSEDSRTPRSVRQALESLQSARGRIVFRYPYGEPSNGAILVARHGLEGCPGEGIGQLPRTRKRRTRPTGRSPCRIMPST